MAYSIQTKDGITINNIPDNVDPNSKELKDQGKMVNMSYVINNVGGEKGYGYGYGYKYSYGYSYGYNYGYGYGYGEDSGKKASSRNKLLRWFKRK